jgi:hypothetical protein
MEKDPMKAWRQIWTGTLIGTLAGAVPAHADIVAQSQIGFVSRNVVVVAGTPAAVWKRLVTPSGWWSSDHTFSGSAANLTLDPVAGGCFCERLPGEGPKAPALGGVQHMRVVYVERNKALRMIGALGPLQSEGVSATLTATLAEVDGGTRVVFEYVVGGYMRYPQDKIMPAVDAMLSNQLLNLAHGFAPVAANAGGPELDKKGMLVPKGRIWSLPAGDTPAGPAPASGPIVAPLPVVVPPDVAASGGKAAKKRAAHAKPAPTPPPPPVEAPVVVVPEPVPAPAPVPEAPAPKPKKATKTKAKPAEKPKQESDEPNRDSVNSAFDAAIGGTPPAAQPTPQ